MALGIGYADKSENEKTSSSLITPYVHVVVLVSSTSYILALDLTVAITLVHVGLYLMC